ncbi:hypothetical protein R3P38DRAFT_3214364 [Favolaschia claudopus]|uniref:Uncharacterized protein n=1 Tax=Favolaschia claudopus TaxID=2862362 RepID=A0AAW0ABU8_9AGAR
MIYHSILTLPYPTPHARSKLLAPTTYVSKCTTGEMQSSASEVGKRVDTKRVAFKNLPVPLIHPRRFPARGAAIRRKRVQRSQILRTFHLRPHAYTPHRRFPHPRLQRLAGTTYLPRLPPRQYLAAVRVTNPSEVESGQYIFWSRKAEALRAEAMKTRLRDPSEVTPVSASVRGGGHILARTFTFSSLSPPSPTEPTSTPGMGTRRVTCQHLLLSFNRHPAPYHVASGFPSPAVALERALLCRFSTLLPPTNPVHALTATPFRSRGVHERYLPFLRFSGTARCARHISQASKPPTRVRGEAGEVCTRDVQGVGGIIPRASTFTIDAEVRVNESACSKDDKLPVQPNTARRTTTYIPSLLSTHPRTSISHPPTAHSHTRTGEARFTNSDSSPSRPITTSPTLFARTKLELSPSRLLSPPPSSPTYATTLEKLARPPHPSHLLRTSYYDAFASTALFNLLRRLMSNR